VRSAGVRALRSLLLVAALASLTGCSGDEELSRILLERAAAHRSEGQTDEALSELYRVLQIDPRNVEANVQIAEVLADDEHYLEATHYYGVALRLDPTRSDAALAQAKLLLFDATDRAAELVDEVIRREPRNPLAHVRRAEVALARGDAEAALASAREAVSLAPDDVTALAQLGIAHQARIRERRLRHEPPDLADFQAAADAFARAAERDPQAWFPRIQLGRIYAAWPDHPEQAEAAFRAAVEASSTPADRARAAAAVVAQASSSGNGELLRWALEQLVAATPEDLTAWDYLAAEEERREAGAGDRVYQRLVAARPDDVEAHAHYARFLVRQGRRADAIAYLRSRQSELADAAPVLEQIAALQLASGDREAARAVVAELVEEHPDAPATALARGRLALADGDAPEAVAALRSHAQRAESAEGDRLLALAELATGNPGDAQTAVDRALARTPGPAPELRRLAARVRRRSGDWEGVLDSLRGIARHGGRLGANDRVRMAEALYETGRPRAARHLLEAVLEEGDPPDGAFLLFAVRERERDPEAARSYLARLLDARPGHPGALQLLTQWDLEAGRLEPAQARLDRAERTRPLSPSLLLLRARIRAERGDLEGAERDSRRAVAAAPELRGGYDLLARIYTQEGRLDEAIDSLGEADRAGALPPDGQVLRARLLLAAGRHAEARAAYEKALRAGSQLPGAKNDLAWVLANEGEELDRALELAQEARRAGPDSPEFADTLGFVYYRRGAQDAAIEQFRAAIELGERRREMEPELHHHLGLALRASGRDAEAARAFAAALAIDPEYEPAKDARRELEASPVPAPRLQSAAP
jgi:tetratricopeptide (TPR) repeat protein